MKSYVYTATEKAETMNVSNKIQSYSASMFQVNDISMLPTIGPPAPANTPAMTAAVGADGNACRDWSMNL